MEKECPFCIAPEIGARTIVKNDLAFAFLTYIPVVTGHVLISPIRCVPRFDDLTDLEKEAIFDLRKKVKNVLIKTFGAEGFNYAWNEGKVGGQSVPHFHLHMVPRKKGDTGVYGYEPRNFFYRTGVSEARKIVPEKELERIAEDIRKEL